MAIAERHGWGAASHPRARGRGGRGRAGVARSHRRCRAVARPGRDSAAAGRELETEPVLHYARAFLRLGQGRLEEALAEFRAADRMHASLEREHPLSVDVRGWIVLVQALKGDRAAARAALAAMAEPTSARRPGCASPTRRSGWRTAAPRSARGRAGAAARRHGRRRSTRAGRPSMRCCSTLRRATGSGTGPARRRRSSARSSSPSRTGSSCQFTLAPVRELLERHPKHRTSHATLLATILGVLAGRSPQRRERRRR